MPPPTAERIAQLHRQFSNTIVSNEKPANPVEVKEVEGPDSGMSVRSRPSSPSALQRSRSVMVKNTSTDSRVDAVEDDALTSTDEHDDERELEGRQCDSPADTPTTPTTPTNDIYALQTENALLTNQLQHEQQERERLESELLTMRMAHERQVSTLETQVEDLRDELDCLKKASMSRDASGLLSFPKPVDGGYMVFDVNDRQKSRAMMAAASKSSLQASTEQFDPAASLESKLEQAHDHIERRKPRGCVS